jgi:acrylyl-CoA reductase (NADPH)
LRALVTRKDAAGILTNAVEDVPESELPEGDVVIAIEWSSLNYKDALCLKGLGSLVKSYPNIAGIDLSGRVVESRSAQFHPGQAVIMTGWRVGELRWGGYAQRARVKSDWLVPLPKKLSTRAAMVLGTAGLTAMLAINRLKGEGISPDRGNVLVTGAGGGVGSLAVLLLSRLGYRVSAVTGRAELAEQLRRLGADEILTREDLAPSPKVLDKERFSAAIDSVGGPMLGSVLKQISYGGAVASIGAAATPEWNASVIPFILRGVSILGIDSVMAPLESRYAAWDRVADLYSSAYEQLVTETRLEDLPALADRILAGGIAGRVVVNPRDLPT